MSAQIKKPVVILGAGLAGLTAANYLRRQNVPVRLFEAGSKIAGLAQSFHDDDGFTYDFGAHFITNRLAETVGVRNKCRTVRHYAETVWLAGKSYSHPFGLMRVPRMTADGISAKLGSIGRSERPESAAEWFRSNYGKSLANEVAIPLTESWSGASAEDLSPAVGDGISSGIGRTLWLKTASQVTGRAVACGYSHELPEKASVYHVYPEGGIGALCQKLAEDLEGVIELESPVQNIIVEDDKVVGVRVSDRIVEASAVISTAPVHVLGKIVEGSDALSHLSRFRYRPMVFVNLRFQGRGLLPDVVTWTPESEFPFFRLTETPLSMPWLAPQGKTVITADIGCETGDAIWQMDDETLGEYCVDNLKRLIPDARERYLGCRVMRTPIAYPVFMREYEEDRQNLAKGTNIANLYSIGRNGEFSHIFMEDVHRRTTTKMEHMLKSLAPGKVGTVVSPATSRKTQIAGIFAEMNNTIGFESPAAVFQLGRSTEFTLTNRQTNREAETLIQHIKLGLLLLFCVTASWLLLTGLTFMAQHTDLSAWYRLSVSVSLVTVMAVGLWISRVKRVVRHAQNS